MGFFTYNYFKNIKRPEVYIAYPDKRTIGALRVYDLQTDIMANSANKGSFIIYRYEDGEESKFYDNVEIGMYIHLYGIGWFRINEISVVNEGNNEYKEVTILSIECELGQTYLTSFGSLGTDDDEQGGLDRYCLYNTLDQEHSILHIFLQKNPGWSIAYVDPGISTEYRNFQEDSVDSYSFLTSNVAEVYECVFIFDSYERSVSAYKLENLGKDTHITLNYRNVIKNITMNSNEDDVKTVLTVTGGNDERTNTPLGIVDVNISGTNQIYNFDWCTSMMSQELKDKLAEYNEKCKANETEYQNKISTLYPLYQELNDLKNKVPDEGEDSTDWTKFGLAELKEKEEICKDYMSIYLKEDDSETYQKYSKNYIDIQAEIKVREQQISDKQNEINKVIDEISELIVSLPEFLGDELYAQLGPFIREDTLTDDSFVVTTIMTNDEILDMQQSLLKHGREELAKVSYPQFTLDVDLINFTVDYDYKRFTDALEMFNIIHINFEDRDSMISARLLKMHINWDDPTDFSVTFSNRNSLKETWALFEEVKNQTEDMSSKLEFSTGAWSNAAIVSVDVNSYMNDVLNASKQQLVSNDNNEVLIDSTGIMCRRWMEESNIYDPCQIWITANQIAITQDAWNSVGLALGYIKVGNDYFFGLSAREILGTLIMSEKLIVSNESGSYTINEDGFIAKQGSYEVRINPDDPANIFSISIDNKKLLYVDTNNKKLKFEGDIESISGHIASFTISKNDLISGKVGMSSNTGNNAIAFWAGNTDRNKAPFKVNNNGQVTCSNINITGGTLKVGEYFNVAANGTLTASNANISGTINATSGKIAGWRIDGNKLVGISENSYIEGGRINIGDGFFRAYEDSVYLGDFEVIEADRHFFQSSDSYTGMSAYTEGGNVLLWAGYNGHGESDFNNYQFMVNNVGQVYCKDLYIPTTEWDNWYLSRILDYIWENSSDCGLKDLARRINYLEENAVLE